MKERTRLLVVDDEPDILKLIKARLEAEGFECLVAQGAEEALKVAREVCPSAIILDLVLPEKDGFQIYKELRSYPQTKNIPIIVYTAQSPEVVAQKGFEALEIVDFVLKPFETKTLIFLIEKALKRISNKE